MDPTDYVTKDPYVPPHLVEYVERQLDKQLPRFVKEQRRNLGPLFAQLGGDDPEMLLFFRANFITDILNSLPESALIPPGTEGHVPEKSVYGDDQVSQVKEKKARRKSKKELQEEAEEKARQNARRARIEKSKSKKLESSLRSSPAADPTAAASTAPPGPRRFEINDPGVARITIPNPPPPEYQDPRVRRASDGIPNTEDVRYWTFQDLQLYMAHTMIQVEQRLSMVRLIKFTILTCIKAMFFIGAMIMLYGRASDFIGFESTKLFEVETEFPVMYPDISGCIHVTRLRIPHRFPPDSKCYGPSTASSDPERFAACVNEMMYERPFAEVYNNLTIDLRNSVTRIEGYFRPPFDRTINYSSKKQLNSYTRAFEKEGYKCLTFSPGRFLKEPIDYEVLTKQRGMQQFVAKIEGKLDLPDGEATMLIFLHHKGSVLRGYEYTPISFKLSKTQNLVLIDYNEVHKNYLPYPHDHQCIDDYKKLGFDDQYHCREACILRLAAESDPQTVPEQLTYFPYGKENDTRRFHRKYTGKIVVDLLRICAAECHIDCQRHIYPARIHEVIHDPHKNYTYGIELFIPELKQTITHNLAVTYEDFIMHIYTVTGIFLDHTTEHYNPFYLPLPAIVFIIFALKLIYRKFLPISLKRFFRRIFKFFLDPIFVFVLYPVYSRCNQTNLSLPVSLLFQALYQIHRKSSYSHSNRRGSDL